MLRLGAPHGAVEEAEGVSVVGRQLELGPRLGEDLPFIYVDIWAHNTYVYAYIYTYIYIYIYIYICVRVCTHVNQKAAVGRQLELGSRLGEDLHLRGTPRKRCAVAPAHTTRRILYVLSNRYTHTYVYRKRKTCVYEYARGRCADLPAGAVQDIWYI